MVRLITPWRMGTTQTGEEGREGERDRCVSHYTAEDGELHRQTRKGGREREIVVCLIIPWRMGDFTDR